MSEIEIEKVTSKDIEKLQIIGKQTFQETFSESNSEENMKSYLEEGFATEKLIAEEMESVFAPVSFNLTGGIFVNQHAAFSDFHVTGGNPAGNASFSNPEYVNKRFVWVGHRKL